MTGRKCRGRWKKQRMHRRMRKQAYGNSPVRFVYLVPIAGNSGAEPGGDVPTGRSVQVEQVPPGFYLVLAYEQATGRVAAEMRKTMRGTGE